ncbi:MAG: asparagine synthase (glutamine-hydrolyzing) [Acidimicrobiales bacterium]
MCGIAGVFDTTARTSPDELDHLSTTMADRLGHRGPDDRGVWSDARAGIGFGHRRLAIIDLSPEGHQPMQSNGGHYTVVFNGEIYNHRELRKHLEQIGQVFRGRSDTEVLVAAISEWGLESTLDRCNGMFALAVWDAGARVLSIARDRLGEKPLYYGWAGRHFVFASELKALRAHPGFSAEIDRGALALYLRYSFVPTPYSIYHDVWKLPPGTVLRIPSRAGRPLPDPTPFWRLSEVTAKAAADPFRGTDQDAEDELEALLRDAVRLRMEADVPLGAFLSGGVDSSIVVALMQAQSERAVRTFTVAMPEAGFDESDHARTVARHLGTDHTEMTITASDALALVPKLATYYDEPFSDPSQLPTALLCATARRHVTVSLSGDGGDEVFGGYNRYVYGPRAWRRLSRVPGPARHVLADVLHAVPPTTWDGAMNRLSPLLPPSLRVRNPGDKAHKLATLLAARHPRDLYGALVSQWTDPQAVVIDGREPALGINRAAPSSEAAELVDYMMFADTAVTLPDDMLTKVDRASMAVGLEVRVPLLDHRLVEFAWRLPSRLKVGAAGGKPLLRHVLHRYVPAELVERPKMGFDPPVGNWLRGPLREWAESLLDPSRLDREGFLRAAPVRRAWEEHLSGRRNRDYQLWAVLMFQAWLET